MKKYRFISTRLALMGGALAVLVTAGTVTPVGAAERIVLGEEFTATW
jgi:hypothetical protein